MEILVNDDGQQELGGDPVTLAPHTRRQADRTIEEQVMSVTTRALLGALWFCMIPATASAEGTTAVRDGGVSAIWILANLAYAGMRAQASRNTGWRVLSFIGGFPGTLLTFFVVSDGGERAYGVDLPRRRSD
jgi:hypothetical protein